MRESSQKGIALITVLLVMMLVSALLVGFTAVIMSDQRYRLIDTDRKRAFYAASGAMEKMTGDLGNLFFTNVAPTSAQVTALTGNPPAITNVAYTATAAPTPLPASSLTSYYCVPPKQIVVKGNNGYTISYCTDAGGNPVTTTTNPVKSGPYEGLIAAQTPYQLDVTAKTTGGGEVHLIRTIEAVAIPVFQFGMFSDVDLAFFAGPNFSFGGRVHTNGNLFLAEGPGNVLTLTDKVTAVKEIVRQRLENGVSIDTGPHTGTVSMAKASGCTNAVPAPGSCRALARTEGSVADGIGSALNDPLWQTLSLSSYNTYIRNGRTGAKPLNLPLLTVGGTNPDLVRRPPVGEDVANAILYNERLYTKASIRILLSDLAADITNLPGVTNTVPVQLDGDWRTTVPNNGTAYGPIDAAHPPVARSLGPLPAAVTTTAAVAVNATTIPVSSVPAMFLNPTLSLKTAGNVFQTTVTCTIRTATSFQGCTVPSALTNGWTIYVASPAATNNVGPGNMPGDKSTTRTVTLNGAVAAGACPLNCRTLNLNAGQTTAGFAADTFWLNDVAAAGTKKSTLVTCSGYNLGALQLTGCNSNIPQVAGVAGVPATANGATITTSYLSNQNVGTLGGFIKVERQDPNGVWTDITMEILNYGISDKNGTGAACGDPTPNAILRIQRLRDNGNGTAAAPNNLCTIPDKANSYEAWPQVLYDTREAIQRDNAPANGVDMYLNGAMYYISLDVNNLTKWFTTTAPYAAGTGANSKKDNGGFTVYFSDRRNNRNAASAETSEYGWEDFVNPASGTGAPNNALDAGEDVNGNTLLDTYGGQPAYNGVTNTAPPGAAAPLSAASTPTSVINRGQIQVNRAILFRRALKLVNGNNILGNGVTGLTIVAENPIYVQGDWNANGGWVNPDAATAVIGDAVILLTNAWTDEESFSQSYSPGNRVRSANSWFRMGIISGKGIPFPQPAGTAADFGTDGGAHNFLRYLEGGGGTVNYQGSIATFFYNRQASGTYKCCNTVYQAPTRNYFFDINFLNPALLPPNTPVFRDMNAVGFSQELRPGK